LEEVTFLGGDFKKSIFVKAEKQQKQQAELS
jgi:hypothetical protein